MSTIASETALSTGGHSVQPSSNPSSSGATLKAEKKRKKAKRISEIDEHHTAQRTATAQATECAESGKDLTDKLTTADDTGSSKAKSTKTKKTASPFRIKVGCVVALRHQPASNTVDAVISGNRRQVLPNDSIIHVWSSPVAGRDESLALIGKRVRCHFPKRLVEGKKRRVLEGEVIRLVDYCKRKPGKPWKVELLIERGMLQHFDFLTRVDEDVDISKLNEKAKRNYRNELRIRGEGKVVVKMRLQAVGSLQTNNCVQWAIQKQVPAKLFQNGGMPKSSGEGDSDNTDNKKRPWTPPPGFEGENSSNSDDESNSKKQSEEMKATKEGKGSNPETGTANSSSEPTRKRSRLAQTTAQIRHVGDSNDSPEQQVANWRWLVSRYHDLTKAGGRYDNVMGLSLGLIGRVTKVEPSTDPKGTLALVTVERLLLPEHTDTGRLPLHGKLEVFKEHENSCEFAIPAEQLIVLGLSMDGHSGDELNGDPAAWPVDLFEKHSYDPVEGVYWPPKREEGEGESSSPARSLVDRFLMNVRNRKRAGNRSENEFFGVAVGVVNSTNRAHFALPQAFLGERQLAAPAPKPMKRGKIKGKELRKLLRQEKKNGNTELETDRRNRVEEEDYSVFKPTCAREIDYEAQKKMKHVASNGSSESTEIPRNFREVQPKTLLTEADADDRTNQSRSARAKQRRVAKGVADFSGLDLDTLVSRESQLSFGRSKIHGWGVFADSDIGASEMIVEYRGEIIGNATAEKREKEYEAAKLGLDYMFRIDKDTVCDATKVGCVARFINHSCQPNCYARIITVRGNKRIAIYAKNLIREGEEVCYDYKFPLEYDSAKRIPCLCRSRACRGFMNWDKRYVVAPSKDGADFRGDDDPNFGRNRATLPSITSPKRHEEGSFDSY